MKERKRNDSLAKRRLRYGLELYLQVGNLAIKFTELVLRCDEILLAII